MLIFITYYVSSKSQMHMATFNMYTYQFNPIFDLPIGSLFDEFFREDQDNIMSKKNIVFENVILTAIQNLEFYHRSRKLSAQLIFHQKDIIAFRIANKRKIVLEKKFVESTETNEPSTLILIYNNNIQRIAIEQHREAFPDTDIVAKIIQNAASRLMYDNKLSVTIRKEYCETEFWNFVKANPNKIQMIRFEFEYPNLPRLHETISDVIKEAGKSISGDRAIIQYETTNGGLNLDENNETLKQLNRVSSESGNPITFRLRGMREHHKTGRTTITKEIDSLDITTEKVDDIIKILEAIGNE